MQEILQVHILLGNLNHSINLKEISVSLSRQCMSFLSLRLLMMIECLHKTQINLLISSSQLVSRYLILAMIRSSDTSADDLIRINHGSRRYIKEMNGLDT